MCFFSVKIDIFCISTSRNYVENGLDARSGKQVKKALANELTVPYGPEVRICGLHPSGSTPGMETD